MLSIDGGAAGGHHLELGQAATTEMKTFMGKAALAYTEAIVWDLEAGKEMLTLRGHKSWVYSLALSGEGKRLYSGGGEGTIKAYVSRMLTKLGCANRVQAAVLAHGAGLAPGR